MTADVTTSFLTYYIRSLAERTRLEKAGTKFGFDWIIYNLALADDLTPYRLPFFRAGPSEISKTKTEAEFGVDSSFLSADRTYLYIFVLKDEVLSNSTWTANDFDGDLRRAAAVDLSPTEFKDVREVKIVLAYNKDEDQTGIKLYDNLAKALGTKIGDNVRLAFERWNLTALTEKVKAKLLTPTLLPQRFFSLFNYICSQFVDFRHGSEEWTKQLIPNWCRFLDDLLKDKTDERTVRLLPVALLIAREHGRDNSSAETGWIELTEWAMLAAWRVHQGTRNDAVKAAVFQMWVGFYVAELERYYEAHAIELATEHGLETIRTSSYVDAVAAAVRVFWHIAREGILAISFAELLPSKDDDQKKYRQEAMRKAANWLASLINAHPAALRPLLDLHHIELFLIWCAFSQVGRREDIHNWLWGLHSRLFVRRAGTVKVPFIEGHSSLDLVFEWVANDKKPPEFCDESSLLILFLLELCFSLAPSERNELLARYYQQIVLGRDCNGEQLQNTRPLDLMAWGPPDDWGQKVLVKTLADEGESQTLEAFDTSAKPEGEVIAAKLEDFVRQSRVARQTSFPEGIPIAVIILACLKHRSPLPPELWRRSIFGPLAS
jgi:hypothetical protein